MTRRLAIPALAALAFSSFGPGLWSAPPPGSEGPAAPPPHFCGHPPRPEDRQRWHELGHDRREAIRQIYRLLERIEPSQRQMLLDQLRRLPAPELKLALRRALDLHAHRCIERDAEKLRRASVEKRLPADLRERIAKLPEAERRAEIERWMQSCTESLAQAREKLLSSLPATLQARVRQLPAREQASFLRAYSAHRLFLKTFASAEDRHALLKAPAAELHQILLRRDERPAAISVAAWESWLQLEPFEQGRLVRHVQKLQARLAAGAGRGVASPPSSARAGAQK